ncbi:MAG: T9SS type A sorting domain-containing protein [Bacteroidales bacterium]|nr:T9SS type A sorting domain-containing protein [Bacteroidales bacterium]
MKIKKFTLALCSATILSGSITIADTALEFKSIAIDPNNTVWIGTNQYLYSILSGQSETEMKQHTETINGVSYANLPVIDIAQYVGAKPYGMLLATNKGAVSYNFGDGVSPDELSNGTALLQDKSISAVALNAETKWMAIPSGLSVFSKGQELNINYRDDTQKERLSQNAITSIAINNGTAYITTTGDPGHYCVERFNIDVDGVTGASPYGKWGPCPLLDALCIAFDSSNGEQWIGGNDGLYWHQNDQYKSAWQLYTMANGLANNKVQSLAFAGGYAWAGTPSGISKVKRDAINGNIDVFNYTIDNGLKGNDIIDIAVGSDKVYAISSNALSIIPFNTAIDDITATSTNISVFPNPATEYIKIRINKETIANQNVNICINNLNGSTIKQLYNGYLENDNQELTLALNGLEAGTYLCTIKVGNEYYATTLSVK